jgi:hypothetical protein
MRLSYYEQFSQDDAWSHWPVPAISKVIKDRLSIQVSDGPSELNEINYSLKALNDERRLSAEPLS